MKLKEVTPTWKIPQCLDFNNSFYWDSFKDFEYSYQKINIQNLKLKNVSKYYPAIIGKKTFLYDKEKYSPLHIYFDILTRQLEHYVNQISEKIDRHPEQP